MIILLLPAIQALAQEPPTPPSEPPPIKKIAVKPGIPEGFEALDGPRETAVDVYYGGLKIGVFRAIYTPRSIAFAAPGEIVAKIPTIKNEMMDTVKKAISGEQLTNAEFLCGRAKKEGCGKLTPEKAGIIFNEDKFRVDLFIGRGMLAEQENHEQRILPPAPDVFSSVHSFNGGVTGITNGTQNYSFMNNSTIAYGPGRLNFIGIATNTQRQINTATLSLDKWGLDNKLGFFDSRATQLLPQTHMAGVSVGTSLNTNLSLRDASGSRLSIFLPTRSWVSLVYNDVIYSTDFYEAGNQVLNTDSLPEGAYMLTIRIRDTSGVQTEEQQFYAKNFEIPPEDQPIYYGQFGKVRNLDDSSSLPNVGTDFIAAAGTIQRLNDNMGIDTNFLTIKNTVYNESGLFFLFPPDHQIRASALISTDRDYGLGASYLGYMLDKKLAFTNNIRAIFSGEDNGIFDPTDPITGTTKQASSSVNYQWGDDTNLSFQVNYSQSGSTTQYAYGPTIRYDIWRSGDSNFVLTADSAQTNDGFVNGVFLRYTKRLGQWGLNGNGGIRTGRNESRAGIGRVTWNDDQEPGKLTVIGAEMNSTDNSNTYTADLDSRSNFGNLKMMGSHIMTDEGNTNFYSGNFGFGIAQSGNDITLGGNQQQTSGVILKTLGTSEDVPMEVMVNNTKRTVFNTGESTALFVPPYETYDISIKPKESSSIDFDGAVKHITLYPGNILPMIWDINRIFVVLGHVILPDGTALTNARMEEARNLTVTDEEGMFQGEVLTLKSLTFKRDEEKPEVPANLTSLNKEFDVFSFIPSLSRHDGKPSKMSLEDQQKALLELYGAPEEIKMPEPVEPVLPTEIPPEPKKEPQNDNVPKFISALIADILQIKGPLLQPQPPVPAPKEPPPEIVFPPAVKPVTIVANPNIMVPPTEGEIPPPELPKKLLPPLRCRVDLPDIKEMNGVYIYNELLTCTPIAMEEEKTTEEKTETNVMPNATEQKPEEPVKEGKISIQLGAYDSEEQAQDMRSKMLDMLSDNDAEKLYIMRADLGEKGIFYRLRMKGFVDKESGNQACLNFITNEQQCIIVGSNDSEIVKPKPKTRKVKHIASVRDDADIFTLPQPTSNYKVTASEED